MVKIIHVCWLIAGWTVGAVADLPLLTILSDTQPPSAIPTSSGTRPTSTPITQPRSTSSSSTSSSSSSRSTRSDSTASISSTLPSSTSSADGNTESIGINDAGYENSINPVIIQGNRFFDSVTGDYFAVRGVNYYPRPNTGPLDLNNLDLFSNDFQHIWGRDLPQFTALGANVIRLYAVDSDVDHTDFMCALQAEGIYVIVDLGANCKGCEITADSAPACYPASYKARGEKIIKEFARYDNVLAFSGGNEINHRTGGNPWTWNAPCQKKFIRDMRAFLQYCPTLRQVPVGLVVADTDRDDNALYYNCRTDPSDELENAQWYGINTYVHCEDISDPTKATGFNLLRDSFKGYDYSIPVILTEFGCVSPNFPTVDGYEAQRTFHDARFMNMPEYSDYFAGGVAFEYSTENANSMSTSAYPFKTFGPQNYGLGYFSPEDCTDAGTNCTFERFPNFDFLKEAYTSYDSSGEPTLSNYKVPSNHVKTSTCPKDSPILSDFSWEGDAAGDAEACPSKTEARYQCPNLPPRSFSSRDGSLHLDEINSGSGGDNDNDTGGGTMATSRVPSGHEGLAIRFFLVAFAAIAFYL